MATEQYILLSLLPLVFSSFPLDQCYQKFYVCFGTKDGQNSFGRNYGCIKEDNCDILIQGEAYHDVTLWTLTVSHPTTKAFKAQFSISNDPEPFDASKIYIQVKAIRSSNGLEVKNEVVKLNEDGVEESIDCRKIFGRSNCFEPINEALTRFTDEKTVIDFDLVKPFPFELYYRYNASTYQPNIHLLENQTYIHLYLFSSSEKRASFKNPIYMFGEKNGTYNNPFNETIDCSSPSSLIEQDQIWCELNETDSAPVTAGTHKPFTGFWNGTFPPPTTTGTLNRSGSGLETKWIIIIIFTVLALIIITIGLLHYYCKKKQLRIAGIKRRKEIQRNKQAPVT